MPPVNLRSVFAQLHRRSTGREFSTAMTPRGKVLSFLYKIREPNKEITFGWWFLTRALGAATGYWISYKIFGDVISKLEREKKNMQKKIDGEFKPRERRLFNLVEMSAKLSK